MLLQAAPAPVVHAAGQRVPVEFSLRTRDREGGRITPFYTNYRATISRDRNSKERCEFFVPGTGGVKPGETRRIEMVCSFSASVGRSIEFFENGRPIGHAVVLARPN